MSVISMFSGNFCRKEQVLGRVLEATGYRVVKDSEAIARAAELSGVPEDKLAKAMTSKTSVFNRFTHEKERSVAWLKLAVAQILEKDGLILDGLLGMLIPDRVSHVLRVCLIADIKHRLTVAAEDEGLSEKDAMKSIRTHDEDCAAWIDSVYNNKDPWTADLYDILIPMHKHGTDKAVQLILDNLNKVVVKTTPESMATVNDFQLAARVEIQLAGEGHNVGVSAVDGMVTLTINKNVMLLSRLEDELSSIARRVDGVRDVKVKVGKGFYQTDIYRKADFQMPSKVLLVDDERDFVQTLSERLQLREVGSHVVYDGESALEVISKDEPEVMILDLKMPGINGIEVLKKVKAENPDIEVIILTGHGSEKDRKTCMDLGAFAYLQKPVDVDVLSQTLRQAYEKIRRGKQQ